VSLSIRFWMKRAAEDSVFSATTWREESVGERLKRVLSVVELKLEPGRVERYCSSRRMESRRLNGFGFVGDVGEVGGDEVLRMFCRIGGLAGGFGTGFGKEERGRGELRRRRTRMADIAVKRVAGGGKGVHVVAVKEEKGREELRKRKKGREEVAGE